MNLKPDFERTVTGWVWTDKLTEPYWKVRIWYENRRFDKLLGITGSTAERNENRARIMEQALELSDEEAVEIDRIMGRR